MVPSYFVSPIRNFESLPKLAGAGSKYSIDLSYWRSIRLSQPGISAERSHFKLRISPKSSSNKGERKREIRTRERANSYVVNRNHGLISDCLPADSGFIFFALPQRKNYFSVVHSYKEQIGKTTGASISDEVSSFSPLDPMWKNVAGGELTRIAN